MADSLHVELASEQLCTIPTCRRPTGWPAPGLCPDCYERVCLLQEQWAKEELDADAE